MGETENQGKDTQSPLMTLPSMQERFQALVEQHQKILYKVCNSYCRNRDNREDLAQEIIIQLWRSFERFDERCRFSTWMYRVAINVAISFYRRESVHARHVISDEEKILNTVDETANQSPEVETLYRFIEGMEPLNRALILLYLDGSDYHEISEVLGITETNVATKISRIKQSMKNEARASARA